jgi:hypothetical protein
MGTSATCNVCGCTLDDGMCLNPDCCPGGVRDEKGRFRKKLSRARDKRKDELEKLAGLIGETLSLVEAHACRRPLADCDGVTESLIPHLADWLTFHGYAETNIERAAQMLQDLLVGDRECPLCGGDLTLRGKPDHETVSCVSPACDWAREWAPLTEYGGKLKKGRKDWMKGEGS